MTAEAEVAPPPFEGCPAPAPALVVVVTLTGLAPGEEISLPGLRRTTSGCLASVQPQPCSGDSSALDRRIPYVRPEYSEATKGSVRASAAATADAAGTAKAALRFVIPASVRVCPAGRLPPLVRMQFWEWNGPRNGRRTRLRLVGPPDLTIGPEPPERARSR